MNSLINSKENKLYKKLKSLKDKKARKKEGLFLIEGKKLINEAIANNIEIEYILTTENLHRDTNILLSEELFNNIATTKTPQNLIAVAKIPQENKFSFDAKKILVFDSLNDPQNAGTLIRTAVATGYENILTVNGSLDFFSPKIIRASAGQVFKIKTKNYTDAKLLIDDLHDHIHYHQICVADMNGTPFNKIDFVENHALVLGNESTGVSNFLLKNSDYQISIPMQNNVESLNVAVTGSFLMLNS